MPMAVVEPDTHKMLMCNPSLLLLWPQEGGFHTDISFEHFFKGLELRNEALGAGQEILASHPVSKKQFALRLSNTVWMEKAALLLIANERDAEFYDTLTGLPNMNYFRKQAAGLSRQLLHRGEKISVLYLNLRGMKMYNSTFGFRAGDELLCRMGTLLSAVFRMSRPFAFQMTILWCLVCSLSSRTVCTG